MWSGPTARLLSDGLRSVAAPCGPSNPAPSPSKLAASAAPGRAPCDRCSTAPAPGGLVITGGVMGAAGFCRAIENPGDRFVAPFEKSEGKAKRAKRAKKSILRHV